MENTLTNDYTGNAAQQQQPGKPDLLRSMDLDAVRNEIANLRGQFDKIKETMKDRATQVDSHIHSSPYPYVIGALGLGIAAGLLLNKRRDRADYQSSL